MTVPARSRASSSCAARRRPRTSSATPTATASRPSGVVAVDGRFYVIFDNRSEIGRFGRGLVPGDGDNRLIRQRFAGDVGYEDIAHDRATGRFFILIEGLPRKRGFMAKVREYDERLGYLASAWLPFAVQAPNKGLEGLTCATRAGTTYLLGLCEGNLCLDGDAGRRPGGGRIQVFARSGPEWQHVDTIALPASLWFEDFSSLALAGERLCVLSQESAALWVGRLARSGWRLRDEGAVFSLPCGDDGKTVYCNAEGVSWLSGSEVVVVSDKMKARAQKARCRAKDQSIHVFAIPSARRPSAP